MAGIGQRRSDKVRRAAWPVLLVIAALWLGYAARTDCVARAGVREQAPPKAFESGGARSEAVLREIATILKRIDARLERFERAAIQASREDRNQNSSGGSARPTVERQVR